jgi:hypothetical protein
VYALELPPGAALDWKAAELARGGASRVKKDTGSSFLKAPQQKRIFLPKKIPQPNGLSPLLVLWFAV